MQIMFYFQNSQMSFILMILTFQVKNFKWIEVSSLTVIFKPQLDRQIWHKLWQDDSNICSNHINPKRAGGGGGGIFISTGRNPLSTFHGKKIHAASFHEFFLWSLAQLLALFSEKSGVRFQSYATLCRLKIWKFSGFVYKTWKMASCAKTPFWALKCSICFHYS